MTVALELRRVGKRFGRLSVLREIDLQVAAGEVVGLVGANGAGKTTMLSIAAGLVAPSEGERRLFGQGADEVDMGMRRRFAFVAHTTQLYPGLTARENLALFAALREAAGDTSRDGDELLARLGLAHAADRAVGTFSRGMMQRLALARALAGRPELLLLDEPFTALDPAGRDRLAEVLVQERRAGLAVLLSSHDHEAMVAAASRVVLLADGRLRGEAHGVVEDDPAGTGFRERIHALGRAVPPEANGIASAAPSAGPSAGSVEVSP